MDIVKELTEDLTATVRIKLTPADYETKVNEQIKKTQKTANMPGFRVGMVPAGLIRNKYGKAILFDELNKLVSESLERYITENQIEILGNPLPQPLKELDADWEKPLDYEFSFDLGIAPQFDLQLPPKAALPYYEIEVDSKRIDDYVNELRQRNGNFTNPETADEKCILYGDFLELDETGNPKEKGIESKSTIVIEAIKDDEIKNKLLASKKGDILTIDVQKALDKNTEDIAALLKIKKEQVENMGSLFQYTIDSINKKEPAEINQDLFNKVYGEGVVNSETEFRDKISTEIAGMFANESDRKLQHDMEDVILEEVGFSLPDNFLKRWMLSINDKKVTPEQVEKEYPHHARGIKWRLIENRIFKDNNLEVVEEEIMNFAKQLVYEQFSRYGSRFTDEATITDMANRYIQKQENMNYIIESISGRKVFMVLNSMVNKEVKKVSYDEFEKIVTEHKH